MVLVDDDAAFAPAAAELIVREGYAVTTCACLAEARRVLAEALPDLVLLDLNLPDGSGLELFRELDERGFHAVVLITGNASVGTVVDALRRRALDYLPKPLDIAHLQALLRSFHDRVADNLRPQARAQRRLVGQSNAMAELCARIAKVGATDATVFLHGESGTGKDLVARALHEASNRREHPFLVLNCGALSAHLIASELFGHERGSFTGADRQHKGYFERASGGTLLLDEVGDTPPDLQVHLLRVLETGKVVRLGGDREIEVDVRVIAATNRAPEELVISGRLRQDLFFRLSAFPLHIPALRERIEDIPALSDHFLEQLAREYGSIRHLTAEAHDALRTRSWPGNVRELRNALEHAYIMADRDIGAEHLAASAEAEGGGVPPVTVGTTIDDLERDLLVAALKHFRGNKRRAAQSLGISLKTVYNRLKRYALE